MNSISNKILIQGVDVPYRQLLVTSLLRAAAAGARRDVRPGQGGRLGASAVCHSGFRHFKDKVTWASPPTGKSRWEGKRSCEVEVGGTKSDRNVLSVWNAE